MTIDAALLSQWVPEQRWYGGRGRDLRGVGILDVGVLHDGPPALVIALAELTYADRRRDLYQLPLLVESDGGARDATTEPDRLRLLGELMAHGVSIKGNHGVFQFGGPGLDPLAPPGAGSLRVIGREQSNTSLVFDEHVILKLFRRVAIGPNPDLELTRLLTSEGFPHIPMHLGEITYEGELRDEEVSIDLGVAQSFLLDAVEAWQETLREIHALYDQIDPRDVAEDMRFLIEERGAASLGALEELGEVTASLHVALSREDVDPELLPEQVDSYDLQEWASRARDSLTRLVAAGAEELRPLADAIQARIARLEGVEDAGLRTRVHGDYHLGQVLSTPRGWMILDFEGEPARSLDERRAKQSPLRDVAGMLRSFSYAASTALYERCDPGSDEWHRLEPWANVWETLARERFLHGYLTRSHEGRFLPPDRGALDVMLDVFEIDKAVYELGYERGHRPHWVRIPLRGITRVLAHQPKAR